MASICYWIVGVLTFAGIFVHELAGSPEVLPPLLASDLPANVVWLHRFSWHVDSVMVAAMSFMYIYAARKPGNVLLAGIATAMSAGIGLLGLAHAVWGNAVMWGTPAPYLWPLIAVVGGVGVWAEMRGRG